MIRGQKQGAGPLVGKNELKSKDGVKMVLETISREDVMNPYEVLANASRNLYLRPNLYCNPIQE